MSETFLNSVHAVNVRTLAETYFEGGDLFADMAGVDRMQEGLKGHLMLQAQYPPEFRAEVPVRYACTISGVSLLVQGRVDGLMLLADSATVEEIKTTHCHPYSIGENDHPVHWAQAQIYACIICAQNRLPAATVKLTYLNLDGARTSFSRVYSADTLEILFCEYASPYAQRIARLDAWKQTSVPSMLALRFPYSGFREGQREMAARIYRAIRDNKKVLVEAPTGIGKTMGALFPAVKALGEGRTETVFYLTARTTGRRAAENALAQMRASGLKLRSVTISAKKKMCPYTDTKCTPEACPRAKGYFDRQKTAIENSWTQESFDSDAIQNLARKYTLCPFELSLALAETAEVIICDYNYVFDPTVRLRRFFDHKGNYTLLIDEAHNLVPRARDMFSAELSAEKVTLLRRTVGKHDGKTSTLYQSLTAFLHAFEKAEENELRSELPLKLIDACKCFTDEAKEHLNTPAPYHETLAELFFDVGTFLRASGDFDEDSCKTMILPEGKRCRVKLWCWNPTERLKKITKRMHGVAFFSATLTPNKHYAKMLGMNAEDGDFLLTLPSPFPEKNQLTAVVNIPTRYSARKESAPRVAAAIHAMASAKIGNYLACFPSHAYLNRVAEIFSVNYPDTHVLLQTREMNEDARETYLNQFDPHPQTSMVAFIAMGGVFSEGIDLPGEQLIGAAVVGVGLPQLCYEREALRALYDEIGEEGEGYQTAYTYPGIGKCLQAAGRVIRTDADRGVVLLIDERYLQKEYKTLLPAHYHPKTVPEETLALSLSKFWKNLP